MSTNDVPRLPGPAPKPSESKGNTSLLLVAMILGVLAVVLNFVMLSSIQEDKNESTFTLYQLKKSIETGDKVRFSDLRPVQKPLSEESLYNDYTVRNINQFNMHILDREAVQDLPDGTLIKPAHFDASLGRDGIVVKPGYHMVGVKIDNRNIPSNLKNGDLVDFIGYFGGAGTVRFLENIEIKFINRSGGVITVEVRQDQTAPLFAIMKKLEELRSPIILARRGAGDRLSDFSARPEKAGFNPVVLDIIGYTFPKK